MRVTQLKSQTMNFEQWLKAWAEPSVVSKKIRSHTNGPYIERKSKGFCPMFLCEAIYKKWDAERDRRVAMKIAAVLTSFYVANGASRKKSYWFFSCRLQSCSPRYNSYMKDFEEMGVFSPIKRKGETVYYTPHAFPKVVDGKRVDGFCRHYRFSDIWHSEFENKRIFKFNYVSWLVAKDKKEQVKSLESQSEVLDKQEDETEKAIFHVQKSLSLFKPKKDFNYSKLSDSQRISAAKIESGKPTAKYSKNVGKITSTLSNLPKEYRNGTLGGEETMELDLKSSHWRIIALDNLCDFYFKSSHELEIWRKLLKGDFYQNFRKYIRDNDNLCHKELEKLDRNGLKRAMQMSLGPTRKNPYIFIRGAFKKLFPQLFSRLKSLAWENKNIQSVLQKDEALLVKEFVEYCADNDILVCPIYDSFVIRQSDYWRVLNYWGKENISIKSGKKPEKDCGFAEKLEKDTKIGLDIVWETILNDAMTYRRREVIYHKAKNKPSSGDASMRRWKKRNAADIIRFNLAV